jgi:hypothetical protein
MDRPSWSAYWFLLVRVFSSLETVFAYLLIYFTVTYLESTRPAMPE